MACHRLKTHCFKPAIAVGVIIFQALALAATVFGETVEIEFQLTECSETGGMLVENQCVCKSGYTGPSCDVQLMDDDVFGTSVHELPRLSFQVQAVDDTQLYRVRRQAETTDMMVSGSGETTNETPTTAPATTGFTTSAPTCPTGQVLNSLSQCVQATTLQGRLTTNQTFKPDFNNLSSTAAQEFIANFTTEVEILMSGTTFSRTTVTGLSNGSVIVDGLFSFAETANSPNDLLRLSGLLQSKLRSSNSPFQFLQVLAIDANECNLNPCPNNSDCTNTVGSFNCTCRPGYNGTYSNNRLQNCSLLCSFISCQNEGTCIEENGSAYCRCKDRFSGSRCELDSYPFRQATIAVSIVLGVLLFIAIVLIIFVLCNKARSKKKTSSDIPLATGFKTTDRDDFAKVYENPQADVEEQNRASLRIDEQSPETENFTNTTSTFKPDDGAAKQDEDDKL